MSTSTLPYPLLCVAIAMRAFEARDAYMARARDPATQFAAADWVAIARYYNGVGIGSFLRGFVSGRTSLLHGFQCGIGPEDVRVSSAGSSCLRILPPPQAY
jgi:hypothetical protein